MSNTQTTGNGIDAKRIHIIHNDEESNMSIKDIFDPSEYPQLIAVTGHVRSCLGSLLTSKQDPYKGHSNHDFTGI
ncbi:hypothetical protein [Limosilactobacillus portuensis]|uniref:hypothetical protein n=1 Tax=Limosilactobacillus portuensis TaxID=2742601 RepID=UPI003D746430